MHTGRSNINTDINKSGIVNSSQNGVHPRLEQTVRKHMDKPWQQPLHTPTVEAYRQLLNEGIFSDGRSFILDSGCGTGKSTRQLAELFPQFTVLGVDRSFVRLSRSGVNSVFQRNENCILLRAELTTFWRLLLADGHTPERHYLLYPNPYPKPAHLTRRWHGHPVFPQLLNLGGEIEMRCNWEIYALEFAEAVNIACDTNLQARSFQTNSGISPFEQKYLEREHPLYMVTVPANVATMCPQAGKLRI